MMHSGLKSCILRLSHCFLLKKFRIKSHVHLPFQTVVHLTYSFNTISHNPSQIKQTKALKYLEERKILHCIVMCRANCKRGGKDFLPILMDPEKQGEEPRKVYVTSRWPIHNLWGGATMLLSFVHQAQHSPCRPLSTKKSQKVHQSQ